MHPDQEFDSAISDEPATYEIRFHGEIPPSLRGLLASSAVRHHPTETVLWRDVTDLAEIDLLLDHLQTMGLALCELTESESSDLLLIDAGRRAEDD